MQKETKILIIEDDIDISEVLRLQLELKSYKAEVAGSFKAAQEFLKSESFDLFLIDRMLPDSKGTEISVMLKASEKHSQTPIIMITAMGEPENIIEGLDAGADDYITKPFDINILHARVRAILRSSQKRSTKSEAPLTINSLKIDLKKCDVFLEEKRLNLTHTEYQILTKLAENPGIVFSREKLIEQILGNEVHVTNRTVDTHIAGLRKKMSFESNLIETIRGIGYRFKDYED